MKTLLKPWQHSGTTGFINDAGERVCTGSMMGRSCKIPADVETVRKLHLQRVPFVDGCYDQGGAYWGSPANLYCAWGESDTEQAVLFLRANSRADAQRQALESFPNAKFFN